ncbi:MAG: thiamine pyrophosphate-binding protein [Desulfobacteraceae bacterium]|nr:thiamine pyrophosphate-binding protein [Desulfobacteraceae bacterium]
MPKYICGICSFEFDEEKEGISWSDLPASWICPVCGAPKSAFQKRDGTVLQPGNNVPDHPPEIQVNNTSSAPKTVSDLMVETMIHWGVNRVFGMVGHSNLGLAEAIRKQCDLGKAEFIGIRHEGAAAFAASAYGKLTGKPAAALAIAGPGATNLLTGLWDAHLDRVPVLALTGQIDIQVLGPGAFQEVNLSAAFDAVAGWSQTVLSESRHSELMSLALKNAILNRNVSHLIFPNQVQDMTASNDESADTPAGRLPLMEIRPPENAVSQAVELMRQAERPVMIVGYGARRCMTSVMNLAESLRLPVITTFKAKGQVPDTHPLACGVVGLSGTPIAAHFMNHSDLLIVLGATFSKHTGILKTKPTIQVDFDPMMLGKFHSITVPVWGEIAATAAILLDKSQGYRPRSDPRSEIAALWANWREEKQRRARENRGNGISSANLFAAMSRQTPDNAVITVDVGNNTYSFGRYFESRAQSVIMSGYLGSIGFGFPAAMGAWAGAPGRPIVAITGDGGFGQYMGELTTAVKYHMPIKHILLNNRELGKITKEQRAAHKPVWSTALHNPDFAKFAENCGALGIRVTDPARLDDALREIFRHDGPAMLEVMTDPELI